MYTVMWVQSNPDEGNDDCIVSEDYETKEEAQASFDTQPPIYKNLKVIPCRFIILDGPDLHLERETNHYNFEEDDDDDWKREQAMQIGMGLGIDAYNDFMGNY